MTHSIGRREGEVYFFRGSDDQLNSRVVFCLALYVENIS